MSTHPTAAHLVDEDKGPMLMGVSVSLTTLALIVVVMRVWARLRLLNSFGPDDYMIAWTMLLSLVCMGLTVGQVMYGAGRHQVFLAPATVITGLKLNYAGQIAFIWAPVFAKMSVGLFLLRITPSQMGGVRRIIGVAMFVVLVWTTAACSTLFMVCKNIAVLWDSRIVTTCWPLSIIHALGWASAAVTILSDLFFALMPIAILWNVQMSRKRKFNLAGIMGLGVFACAAAIVKSVYIAHYSSDGDNLWNATELTIWTTVELNAGIIAASLPFLRPYVSKLYHGTWRGTDASSHARYPTARRYYNKYTGGSSSAAGSPRAEAFGAACMSPRTVNRITASASAAAATATAAAAATTASCASDERVASPPAVADPGPARGIHVTQDVTVQVHSSRHYKEKEAE